MKPLLRYLNASAQTIGSSTQGGFLYSTNSRLGFTFCSEPTPLDALAFAYLHSILDSADDSIRMEVARRLNLVTWEKRVRDVVNTTFTLEK